MTEQEFLTEMWPGWSNEATFEFKAYEYTTMTDTFVRITWDWLGHDCVLVHNIGLDNRLRFDVLCDGIRSTISADDSIMLSHEPQWWTQETVQGFLWRLLYRDDGTSRHPGLRPMIMMSGVPTP